MNAQEENRFWNEYEGYEWKAARRDRYRTGKPRNCAEGVAVHVWLGDETKYATVYGGSKQEALWRAARLVRLLNAEQGTEE